MESHERLTDARKGAGYKSATDAARAFGFNAVTYRAHEGGRRGMRKDAAVRYAKCFGVTAEWLLYGVEADTPSIPITGSIGAGFEVYIQDAYEKGAGMDYVAAPPGCGPGSVAVKVKGSSMIPSLFDGDVLIYNEQRRDIASFIGRRVVVGLADGRILVKTLSHGSTETLFTLVSFNAPPLLDVVVEWVSPIVAILPE